MKKFIQKVAVIAMAATLSGAVIVACSSGSGVGASNGGCGAISGNVSQQQQQLQNCTATYLGQTHTAGSLDALLNQHGPTAEMKNVSAKIVRFSDPNKIGYVGVWSANGGLISMDVIKGKVSSTGSELTNTENVVGSADHTGLGSTVLSSPGDDGTYGPEECQGVGIFFFLASTDALKEICVGSGIWQYSDAPFSATTTPLVTVTGNPTTAIPAGGSAHGK